MGLEIGLENWVGTGTGTGTGIHTRVGVRERVGYGLGNSSVGLRLSSLFVVVGFCTYGMGDPAKSQAVTVELSS